MALFTANVTESLNVFGVAPSNKWGDFAWNAFKWGEGTAQIPVFVYLPVSESQGSTSSVDTAARVTVSEVQGATAGLSGVNVLDEAGYYRVFSDRTTDGESQDIPSWSSGAGASASWTTAAPTAIAWS